MRNLVSVLLCVAVAQAGAGAAPSSWLGHQLDPAQTAFCRAKGCTLQNVRQNDFNTMGWHDGTMRRYSLRGGITLEVDVRPAGWMSNARLLFPIVRTKDGWSGMTPNDHRLAAEFLSVITGRRFSAASIAACERAGLALHDPDAYGPREPLSHWSTPDGLPFRARCGVGGQLGVWAGWMQA